MEDDFRERTCGECAWAGEFNRKKHNNPSSNCRRVSWACEIGSVSEFTTGCIWANNDACPAFVPREALHANHSD